MTFPTLKQDDDTSLIFRSNPSSPSTPQSSPEDLAKVDSPTTFKEESVEQQQQEPMETTYDDDVTYEPITEPFMFEDQIIYPCYVVLPFVTDLVVEAACNPRASISVSPSHFDALVL